MNIIKIKKLTLRQRKERVDKNFEELNTKELLDDISHQVRWLYKNSGKCTMVVDEKSVRLIVFKLEQKIKELTNENQRLTKLISTPPKKEWNNGDIVNVGGHELKIIERLK